MRVPVLVPGDLFHSASDSIRSIFGEPTPVPLPIPDLLTYPWSATTRTRIGIGSERAGFASCVAGGSRKSSAPMRIASWNVNGIRAVAEKGFGEWLDGCGADVVGVQETRCSADQVPEALRARPGWHTHWVCAERKGYSGVGLLSRRPFDEVQTSIGVGTMDREGRVQIARIGRLTVVNCYFPNGNGKERDNSRVPFKLRFYRRLHRVLELAKAAGEPIVVMGDFNTAPEPIDLARPQQNTKTSGFLPEERKELARWLASGWVDTFRAVRGEEPGHYTWWSQRFGVREKNIGWRIDLALASPGAARYVADASIHPHVRGSDHCPITVDLDDAVLGSVQPAIDARISAAVIG